MARDTLRLVTLSDGGRPVPVLDLNDADGYWRPQRKVSTSNEPFALKRA